MSPRLNPYVGHYAPLVQPLIEYSRTVQARLEPKIAELVKIRASQNQRLRRLPCRCMPRRRAHAGRNGRAYPPCSMHGARRRFILHGSGRRSAGPRP